MAEPRSWVVIDPNGSLSMAHGLLTFLVLACDAFMVPWVLAWDVPLAGVILGITFTSALFWTLDMLLGFFVGFYEKQRLELRLRYTASHHARTWFLPDLCAITVDWLILMPTVSSITPEKLGSLSTLLRLAKFVKIVRILGLLRMVKLSRIFTDFVEGGFFSEFSRLALHLLRFLAAVVWMGHLVACIWFRIGILLADGGMSWVHTAKQQETPRGMVEMDFLQCDLLSQYVTAFHWSIAQLSLGSTEIVAHNSVERSFTIICTLIGFLGGSTLISSLSATMVNYQAAQTERQDKIVTLRRFLRENRGKVTKGTALHCLRSASERLRLTDRLQEEEVKVLELLPAGLRRELRYEIYRDMLSCHGLLKIWAMLEKPTMQQACLDAMSFMHYQPLDDLFSAGQRSGQAYFLSQGRLQYVKEPVSAPVHFPEVTPVEAGSWLAEAALWCDWIHVGTARAESLCEVLVVPAESVMVQQRPEIRNFTAQYATRFHELVLASKPPEAAYPDDLLVPEAHFEELVTSLQPSVQRQVSTLLISHAGGHRRLRESVRTGECCVVARANGSLERVICTVALDLQDSRRQRVLAQIGKASHTGVFLPACGLPKRRVEQGERAKEAMSSLMQWLGMEEHLFKRTGMERQEEEQTQGADYGVPTRAVQRVYHLALIEPHSGSSHQHILRTSSAVQSGEGCVFQREHTMEFFVDEEEQGMYAWVSAALFEYLQTAAGERELGAWLEELPSRFRCPLVNAKACQPTPMEVAAAYSQPVRL